MNRPRPRRRRLWQGGVLAVAAALTAALAQSTTSAAFTARTSDTANQLTAKASFCTPGSVDLVVAADTAVYQAQPTTSFGTQAYLGTASGGTENGHTFLRFSVATRAPLPRHCTVTSAVLTVQATNPVAGRTLEVHRADRAWTTALTWNTPGRPQPTGTPATTASRSTAGPQTWDVTTLTQELYTGPDHGFLLKDAPDGTTVYQLWASLESASPPRLAITWG
ncbi:DNRLRE domain-containing protein [Blastococcus sp. CCUG 61487]|uniref:DNRLRE domain-containing protein n=1 Tax=Blastococcus sp. CCUG 61487 TaxID=1840703 RepID=UPI0011339FF1|nr:DNRLRE domain-containing protein [Blastococcus sp. CCUG 61487]TKJ18462.1 hypothetical protein A6V29_11630 [Blastococcus sp. CCUG 61487]